MGGLWVDYDLQSTIPGLFVIGEANFSDHGANRLGASALMQGLADGYFVLPATISDYLAGGPFDEGRRRATRPPSRRVAGRAGADPEAARRSTAPAASASFHRELGQIMWDHCGMERTEEGLRKALDRIPELREEFWTNVKVVGDWQRVQPGPGARRPGGRLHRARPSSCASTPCTAARAAAATSAPRARPPRARRSATTRTSPTSPPGSGRREGEPPVLHREALEFEYVHLAQRSYK